MDNRSELYRDNGPIFDQNWFLSLKYRVLIEKKQKNNNNKKNKNKKNKNKN